jgi:multiple sugar transport system permease protein/raffinose/stachyose/melibiose transport system permease protein
MLRRRFFAARLPPVNAAPRTLAAHPWTTIMIFLLPTLVVFAGLTAYPVIKTLINSFHHVQPGVPDEYVGLKHYIELLTEDDTIRNTVAKTYIWAVVAPVIDVVLGLLLALALYTGIPGSRFFRVAWFSPVLISYVVIGVLWMWIYNADWGIANGILNAIGLGNLAQVWLGNPKTALWALIFVDAWKWAGFHMVVCLAALHSLPREVLEAAELDNCGWLAKLWFVMVPMIRATLLNLLVLAFIGKMKVFDLVWIMTKGGPLWSTETVSTYVFKRAFEWSTFDLGYPSAIASLWFAVVVVIVLALTWALRSRDRLEF